jgi:Transposase zinc-binding domain/Putative transposase
MTRPALEVADILRGHGPAWRAANRGHASLDQLKAMSAIERCRTAALGGHVARCENAACGHTLIAYNSCRNRHCPKRQAAASRRWLADREAEPLPVPYFHVVYTLPGKLRDIAYHNKRVVYDPRTAIRGRRPKTTLAIAADPKRRGARIAIHRRAAHVGLDPYPSSARAHDRARRRALARRRAMGRLPLRLPRARQPAGAPLQRQDAGDACRCARRRPVDGLQRPGRARRQEDVQALPRPTARRVKWVVYCKAPFAGPKQVLRYLSRNTHRAAISNSRLVALDEKGVTFKWKDYRIKGRDRLKTMSLDVAEFNPPLSPACAAKRLPPHPPYVDGLLASGFRRSDRFGRLRSYVRPVGADRTAGPDDIRQSWSLSLRRARGSWRMSGCPGLSLRPCRSSRRCACQSLRN